MGSVLASPLIAFPILNRRLPRGPVQGRTAVRTSPVFASAGARYNRPGQVTLIGESGRVRAAGRPGMRLAIDDRHTSTPRASRQRDRARRPHFDRLGPGVGLRDGRCAGWADPVGPPSGGHGKFDRSRGEDSDRNGVRSRYLAVALASPSDVVGGPSSPSRPREPAA